MLKEKYIQIRDRGRGPEYLVIFPKATYPPRTLCVTYSLNDAVLRRNSFLGYDPDLAETPEIVGGPVIIRDMELGHTVFGTLGDTHLGSRFERLDVLNALYDKYAELGIKTVFHTGNFIEGENAKNKQEVAVWGLDKQINYFLEKYPQRPGVKTYFIAGDDHEGWYNQRELCDIGQMVEDRAKAWGRKDLVYLGYAEADIDLMLGDYPLSIRVLHPGGGSAYAISHKSQKIVDSYVDAEKPDILLVGHYHKADHLPYKGVEVIQTGCCVDQSLFMRKGLLVAAVGGWVVDVTMTASRPIVGAKFIGYPQRVWRFKPQAHLVLEV